MIVNNKIFDNTPLDAVRQNMIKKDIIYFGSPCVLICDEKCNKAWGINQRERHLLSDDEDDYEWLTDDELGEAPRDPGTYEGGHAKPTVDIGHGVFDSPNADASKLNKWCCRECERSEMIEKSKVTDETDFEALLDDFSKRKKNKRD